MHTISQQDICHICFPLAFLFPFKSCSLRDPFLDYRTLRCSKEPYKSKSPQTTHIYITPCLISRHLRPLGTAFGGVRLLQVRTATLESSFAHTPALTISPLIMHNTVSTIEEGKDRYVLFCSISVSVTEKSDELNTRGRDFPR